MRTWARGLASAALAAACAARAGHEFPFYPSFYPQEITVEALDARSAAERLAKGTLHAYAGTLETEPPKTAAVASLGGYVVATLDQKDCGAARSLKPALGAGAVWHPYPITPFHADYLHHADRAEAEAGGRKGAAAHARLETVEIGTLLAKAAVRHNGWSGPPWIRQGWFHAYLLLAPGTPDARIENAAQRLMRGDYRSLEERIALERSLVALLQGGCERFVVGYTVRRERYGEEYSNGVENVGYDALEGLASAIFPRTVKLRDFPWNGWLNVAAPAAPSSPWNPVQGGFDDAFGRLVWSAVSDPAFLPAPHGGGWIENRVSAAAAQSGASRTVYHVRASAFHDGTSMGFADVLYAYVLAKPETAKGVRLLRVETQTLAFGEDKLTYEVPVIEVDRDAAPPWTTLPWHLLALFEEGARRGYFKLSAFDPVRDPALVRRLSELVRELEARGYVPGVLAKHVTVEQAKERYRRLRQFHAAHGHWLVTNGPYLLSRWDGAKAVLAVFRDPTYPKGLGSFNAYAVPLKAHIARIERDAQGARVHTETEWLERLGRDVRVVRGAFAKRLAERLTGPGAPPAPVCHFMLVDADSVAAAGAVTAGNDGTCRLPLKAGGRLVVAAVLEGAAANAPIRIVSWSSERR